MTPLRALVLSAAFFLTACATSAPTTGGRALPVAVREAPGRYVVVTVRSSDVPRQFRAAGSAGGYPGGRAYRPSRAATALMESIASDHGLSAAASWPITLLGVNCIVYQLPDGVEPSGVIERLTADRRVESAQPLGAFSTQSSGFNDPYARMQQSLAQMAVAPAQQWSTGAGVSVAVIDTGVDHLHPDLTGRVVSQRNFVDDDADAFDSDRHGTAVAGVIGAVANNRIGIAGVAPEVHMVALKACWQVSATSGEAKCNTFTLAQALAVAVESGVDVVNLSLAGPADPLLARLVTIGLRRGIVFVGAAPPGGARSGFPGDIQGVITVDAPGRRSGAAAELVAPGVDVLTLAPHGGYDFASGSSLAAAQVTAVVALVRAVDHGLQAESIRSLLVRTSRQVTTSTVEFRGINACEALAALSSRGLCPPPGPAGLASDAVPPEPDVVPGH